MESRRLSDWAQVFGSIAVVISVVFLLQEVRGNTLAVERQAAVDRAAALSDPFFQASELRTAFEKVRAVDGESPLQSVFIDRYEHTPSEALVWTRHLLQLWSTVEADFNYGNRDLAAEWVRALIANPDNRLFLEHHAFGGDFAVLVREAAAAVD